MSSPGKDQLAAEAMQCWADFQERLSSDKQKYPVHILRFGSKVNGRRCTRIPAVWSANLT